MKILAVDTSSAICSTAILENDKLIDENNLDNGRTHSETLIPLIQELLDSSKISLKDIELIGCDIGPRFIYWNSYRNCNSKSNCRIFKYSNCFSFFIRIISI